MNAKSIYNKKLHLQGKISIELNPEERMMICEALAKAAPSETDILPAIMLTNRIIKGA